MKLSEIAAHRLVNQQLAGTTIKSAGEMLQGFGAMQAQEYAHSKWSFGLRMPELTSAAIEKDFTSGKILRTHVLRPTWHFVSAKDIRWMLMLTAPRVHAVNAYMYRKLKLDEKLFQRCNKILDKVLHGNKSLTREAINLEFKKSKIEAEGHRLSYIMMQAELEGIICSGPREGNQFTYALLEERVPEVKPKSREEALAELTKRFFTGRGPATLKDFSTWSGLTLTDCKKGMEMVKDSFSKEKIEGNEYFFSIAELPSKKHLNKMHLLPIYDEYIMGYKDRSAIMPLDQKPVFNYDNMILLEGRIVGTWKRTIKTKSIELEHAFFEKPVKSENKLFEEEVAALEKFYALKVEWMS